MNFDDTLGGYLTRDDERQIFGREISDTEHYILTASGNTNPHLNITNAKNEINTVIRDVTECPECHSKRLMVNYAKAELYCADCGLILEEEIFTPPPVSIMYNLNNIDKGVADLFDELTQRCGGKIKIGGKVEYVPERKDLVNTEELTSWGLLMVDVNNMLSFCSKYGLIHYGRVRSREPVMYALTAHLKEKYSDIAHTIGGEFTIKERRRILKGEEAYVKNLCKKIGVKTPLLFDKYAIDAFDPHKWLRCFDGSVSLHSIRHLMRAVEIIADFLWEKMEDANILKKLLRTSPNWLNVCYEIYIIHYIEKGWDMRFLKADSEVRKVFGITKETYRRRINFLDSILKPILATF